MRSLMDVTVVTAGRMPNEQSVPIAGPLSSRSDTGFPPGDSSAPQPAASPVPPISFPPLATQAANLFESVVALVGDGCGVVDDTVYQRRLDICRTCDRLRGNRCTACGCFIKVKARGRIFRCPIGRWE